MAGTNQFLPFATGAGANVESQATYAADPNLPIGNQPGIASSAFNNKALRQANYIASQLAQFMVNQTGLNANDDGVTANIQAVFTAAFRTPPTTQVFTSGTGTYTTPAGCLYLRVRMVGGGGGGFGTGTSPGAAVNGSSTTFGAILTAAGGVAGTSGGGGNGGASTTTLTNHPILVVGQGGTGGAAVANTLGGPGGSTFFGSGGLPNTGNAATNSGGGGSGATSAAGSSSGGGAGGFIDAIVLSPASTYSYGVGTSGTGGTAGSGGSAGGNGAAGQIVVTEYYQ